MILITETPSTLIYLHIPKAAGSTLLSVLLRQYERNSVLVMYGDASTRGVEAVEKIKEWPEEQRMPIRVLIGHLNFGIHEYLKQPASYITFLRNPVERIVSQYHYVIRTPDHYLRDKIETGISNLKEYVASGITDELNNGQTRLISGVGASVPFGECTPEILERAQNNLQDHFSFVGISERFDEGLILLKNAFGWRTPYYERINVARKRVPKESISQDTLDTIVQYNQLDIQLYEYVKDRFEKTIAMQSPSFQKELAKLNRWNMYYGKYRSLRSFIKAQRNKFRKRP